MLLDGGDPVVVLYELLDEDVCELCGALVDFEGDDALGHGVASDVFYEGF